VEEKVRHKNPEDKEEKEMIITLTVVYNTESIQPETLEEELRKFLKLRSDQPQTTPDVAQKEA